MNDRREAPASGTCWRVHCGRGEPSMSDPKCARPITHNIAQLLDALQAHAMEAVGYRDLIALNPYAVRLRYVGLEPETPGVDREAVVGRIESLMERVRWQLD